MNGIVLKLNVPSEKRTDSKELNQQTQLQFSQFLLAQEICTGAVVQLRSQTESLDCGHSDTCACAQQHHEQKSIEKYLPLYNALRESGNGSNMITRESAVNILTSQLDENTISFVLSIIDQCRVPNLSSPLSANSYVWSPLVCIDLLVVRLLEHDLLGNFVFKCQLLLYTESIHALETILLTHFTAHSRVVLSVREHRPDSVLSLDVVLRTCLNGIFLFEVGQFLSVHGNNNIDCTVGTLFDAATALKNNTLTCLHSSANSNYLDFVEHIMGDDSKHSLYCMLYDAVVRSSDKRNLLYNLCSNFTSTNRVPLIEQEQQEYICVVFASLDGVSDETTRNEYEFYKDQGADMSVALFQFCNSSSTLPVEALVNNSATASNSNMSGYHVVNSIDKKQQLPLLRQFTLQPALVHATSVSIPSKEVQCTVLALPHVQEYLVDKFRENGQDDMATYFQHIHTWKENGVLDVRALLPDGTQMLLDLVTGSAIDRAAGKQELFQTYLAKIQAACIDEVGVLNLTADISSSFGINGGTLRASNVSNTDPAVYLVSYDHSAGQTDMLLFYRNKYLFV